MQHQRVNHGFLAGQEQRALYWLVKRIPAWVKPDHLTAVGVGGAVVVMIGFLLANLSPWSVLVVICGLLLNWYGDSLDGTLARYRCIERPQIGYLIDHSCDLISQTLIFLGFGLSPYFTMFSALFALSMYFLMTSYTYLKVMIMRTHQLAYGGMGATELRLALACWSLMAIPAGAGLTTARWAGYRVLDEGVGTLWILIFIRLIWQMRSDLHRFGAHFAADGHSR